MKLSYFFNIIPPFTTSNQIDVYKKSFSLYYYDLVRSLFITLAFTGILSTGWFGIPLAPHYFTDTPINNLDVFFVLFSSLGSIWGMMAYREFTKTRDNILLVRDLCKKLDPVIGEYDYSTFNPITKKYEQGFVPLGPTDFWDRETVVPDWLDKGKYWHIMLRLRIKDKDIILKVVKDNDLPFFSGRRNVATTLRENLKTNSKFKKKYRYAVCIPQWLVMNTEMSNFSRSELNLNDSDFGLLINAINKQLGLASNDITEHEKQRIKYSWKFSSLPIYLIKSLPIQIIYKEFVTKTAKYISSQKKHIIEETNINLAYLSNDELIESLLILARLKNIRSKSIEKINILLQFLKNEYEKLGLGDGSKRYHNLHHSLEVAYISLQMLPEELHGYYFSEEEYEYLIVASLLHDYDPYQYNYKTSIGLYRYEGPKVENTIRELLNIRIIDAYFSMNVIEFKNYFRQYHYHLLPPVDYVTTHHEFVKSKPQQSLIIEALIWRTDYPFTKKLYAQRNYKELIDKISNLIGSSEKYILLSEVLSLTDLSVTYMGSDPISAWYRVTSLYEELDLPQFEAVSRTDQFFSEIMKIELFQELLNNRNFSRVFEQRWNLVYQFYHEGNPSTQINRTIESAQTSYSKINLQIGVKTGDILYHIAIEHKDEYFIGISTDEDAVLLIKDKFANLKQQNVSCFWGDAKKLLPNLQNKSIDNILLILDNFHNLNNHYEQEAELLLLFKEVSIPLKLHGTFQILTNINKNSDKEKEIIKIASNCGFRLLENNIDYKIYFTQSYIPKEFIQNDSVSILLFHFYLQSPIV